MCYALSGVCYGTAGKSARIRARSASGNEGAAAIRSVRSTFISTVPYEIFSIFGAAIFQILGARLARRLVLKARLKYGLDHWMPGGNDATIGLFSSSLTQSQSIWPRLRSPHGLFLSSTLFLLSFFQVWLCRKKHSL